MYSISKYSTSVIRISWTTCVSKLFMQSIRHIIPATIYADNQMDIIVSKAKPLSSIIHFEYDMLVRLSTCISKQIGYMEKHGITLIGLDMDDIISINDGAQFVVANYTRVIAHFNASIHFDTPFYKPIFSTIEVKAINRIPATISYLSARHSLGMLVISLVGDIESIKYTKLYWFLKRILSNEAVAFV